MASEVKADKLSPSGGTALQIGDASDTITIPTGATLVVTDGIGVASGGTGLASFTAGDILYATGTTTLAKLAKGSAEQILSMNSGATAPEWATAAATAGGTGQTGFTAGDLLYANSTTTLTKLGKGTGLQGLQTNSGATAPEWVNSPQSLMTAAGDVLYASGANTLAKLAKGSDDEVLTLASGVPSWASAAGGGAWTLISTITGNDVITEAAFTTFSTDYRDFRVIGSAVTPGTDAQDCYFQIRSAGANVTSGYTYAASGSDEDSTVRTWGSGSQSYMSINYTSVGNVGGENIYFEITIEDVHSTVNQKAMSWVSSNPAAANKFEQARGGGRNETTTAAVDGCRFYFSGSSTIKSGTLTLYGRSNT